MDLEVAADVPEARRARHLAHAARKRLLERALLPEEFITPLLAAAVYDRTPASAAGSSNPRSAPSGAAES
ncbi:hypothetical protein [Streptomyces sp. NPDC001205]